MRNLVLAFLLSFYTARSTFNMLDKIERLLYWIADAWEFDKVKLLGAISTWFVIVPVVIAASIIFFPHLLAVLGVVIVIASAAYYLASLIDT